MSGRSPRQKGDRRERQVVALFDAFGLEARRRPLSGADHFEGKSHDIDLFLTDGGEPVYIECKARRSFSIQKWMHGVDMVVLVPDRSEPLIVMTPEIFARILGRRP